MIDHYFVLFLISLIGTFTGAFCGVYAGVLIGTKGVLKALKEEEDK